MIISRTNEWPRINVAERESVASLVALRIKATLSFSLVVERHGCTYFYLNEQENGYLTFPCNRRITRLQCRLEEACSLVCALSKEGAVKRLTWLSMRSSSFPD